jgi:hypothetical protein
LTPGYRVNLIRQIRVSLMPMPLILLISSNSRMTTSNSQEINQAATIALQIHPLQGKAVAPASDMEVSVDIISSGKGPPSLPNLDPSERITFRF